MSSFCVLFCFSMLKETYRLQTHTHNDLQQIEVSFLYLHKQNQFYVPLYNFVFLLKKKKRYIKMCFGMLVDDG